VTGKETPDGDSSLSAFILANEAVGLDKLLPRVRTVLASWPVGLGPEWVASSQVYHLHPQHYLLEKGENV